MSRRYYELREDAPQLLSLSEAPKYIVSTDRFSIVNQSKALITLQMIVMRRNAEGTFQEDLYPPTVGTEPSITFDAWKAGEDAVPKTISLEGGVQLGEAKAIEAPVGEDTEALRAEVVRLQARVAELEGQLARKNKT
jgi:coronin-1B/1C/6